MEPSDFYTGLVAELYESLIGHPPSSDRYAALVAESGEPALELACGSGLPLIDLVGRGLDVVGLDASADMLERARRKAEARGLRVELHRGLMQDFDLGRAFRTVFVGNGSFTLLTSDADALATLRAARRHLLPDGSLWLDLEVADPEPFRRTIGRFRETVEDGHTLRCGVTAVEVSPDGRDLAITLRYERRGPDGSAEALERPWLRRSWSPPQVRALLREAGLRQTRCETPQGTPAGDDAREFLVRAVPSEP